MFTSLDPSAEFWDFEFGEARVIARPDVHGLFLLNETATFIWRHHGKGVSADSLARLFSREFSIPMSQAAHDIEATLTGWSSGLLSNLLSTTEIPAGVRTAESSFRARFSRNYSLGQICVGLAAGDEEIAAEIEPRLAHLECGDQSCAVTFQLLKDNDRIKLIKDGMFLAEAPEVNAARAILFLELTGVAHPEADWLTALHAGACGTSAACVIMPADTNAGKTTLTAALMHSGLHFLSDDSAAIDRHTLRVAPMPFALMVREGSWPILASRFPELVSAPIFERNGWRVRFLAPPENKLGAGVPAKCLLFIEYRPGAPTSLESLTPFEGLLRLQKSGFWVPHNRESLAAFLSWIQSIPAYHAVYSDLDEATALVHRLLADVPIAE